MYSSARSTAERNELPRVLEGRRKTYRSAYYHEPQELSGSNSPAALRPAYKQK